MKKGKPNNSSYLSDLAENTRVTVTKLLKCLAFMLCAKVL